MPGVVVGVDGSSNSLKAFDWALKEAAIRQASLTVLAVVPVATSISGLSAQHYPADEEARLKVKQAIQEAVDKVTAGRSGLPSAAVQAVSGLPADELVKASADADLLVLGDRGHGGFARLMMGSVSVQVSQHALCPVVIVPGERPR